MTHAGGTKLGPYEIISLLGAGGMGEVYRARDPRLGRDVAIKVLPPEVVPDAERLKRFEQEARAAGALNHPNVLSVYDIGSENGTPYIVSELLEGETLRERLRAGPPSARKAVEIAAQIARGLAAAHEKGIVHRDLKPENVFLTKDDRVKILDFGLAKLTRRGESAPELTASPTESILTGPGVVFGTVGYMSPEQVRGEAADHRSDFFSFGTILYEMLSGKNPFRAATAAETMTAILREEPSFSYPAFSAAPGLSLIVARCLEKTPGKRFHSSEDMAFALEALSQPSPSLPGLATRPVSVSRLRVPILLGALVLVLVAAGLATRTLWQTAAPALKFTQVTFGKTGAVGAKFAPDGQTIVFSALGGSRDAKGAPVRELFTARIGNPEPRPLGIKRAGIASISRSGEMLIRSMKESDAWHGTISRVPLGGGAPREILEDAAGATWAPDSENIAAIHQVDGKERIEYPLGHVLVDSFAQYLGGISFSPDGKYLAFRTSEGLKVTDLEGKQTAVDASRGIFGSVWLPDGRRLLVFDFKEGWTDVVTLTRGGDRRLVVSWPGAYLLNDIAPDGRLLAALAVGKNHVFGRAPGEARDRALECLDGSFPVGLSDDGKTLLLNVTGPAVPPGGAVYIQGMDGSPAKRLGEGRAFALSPDGKSVLCGVRGPPSSLVILPTGAGQSKTLGPSPVGRYGPERGFHPDGRHVWFSTVDAKQNVRCFLQAIDGGEPRPITPEGVDCEGISPDGKWLLVTSDNSQSGPTVRKYQLQPLEGGPPRAGFVLGVEEELIRWSSDGRWVFVSTRTAPARVYRIDPLTGRRELHTELDVSAATELNVIPVVLSGDGKTWAYSYWRMTSDLFVVEGLK